VFFKCFKAACQYLEWTNFYSDFYYFLQAEDLHSFIPSGSTKAILSTKVLQRRIEQHFTLNQEEESGQQLNHTATSARERTSSDCSQPSDIPNQSDGLLAHEELDNRPECLHTPLRLASKMSLPSSIAGSTACEDTSAKQSPFEEAKAVSSFLKPKPSNLSKRICKVPKSKTLGAKHGQGKPRFYGKE